MPTLRSETARNGIVLRLQQLNPAAKAKWGQFNASRMLCHLSDTLAMSLGEITPASVNKKAFHRFPLKHLILYVLPFPKSAPTVPELLSTAAGDFGSDRGRVVELINRLAAAPDKKGPEHPLFGPLTTEEWNALQWKHIDHHLKQFGR